MIATPLRGACAIADERTAVQPRKVLRIVRTLGRRAGAYAATADEVAKLARLVFDAFELDPEVADRVRFLPARQHPRAQHAGLLTRRIDPPDVGLDQERQQHVHRRRLARSVDTTQEQPSTGEVDRLVAVLVDVQDPGTMKMPTADHSRGSYR